MQQSFPILDIQKLKREAKMLRRSLSIPHHKALDIIAMGNGFKNWLDLMKHHTANDHKS